MAIYRRIIRAEGAEMKQPFGIDRYRISWKKRHQLVRCSADLDRTAVRFKPDDSCRRAGDDHVDAISAIAGDPGRQSETGETFFPLTGRGETMNAAVRAVGNVSAAEPVESDSKRLP